jgi:PRTRC genetic system protein C
MSTKTPRARRYTYNGMELPEPPSADGKTPKPEEVRDFWAATYPELGSAKVKGPTPDGDVDVYSFERNVGVKG